MRFQSTAPVGVPTLRGYDQYFFDLISIHGTRGGADSRMAQENGAKNWYSCVICKKILKVLLGFEGVLGFVVV